MTLYLSARQSMPTAVELLIDTSAVYRYLKNLSRNNLTLLSLFETDFRFFLVYPAVVVQHGAENIAGLCKNKLVSIEGQFSHFQGYITQGLLVKKLSDSQNEICLIPQNLACICHFHVLGQDTIISALQRTQKNSK